MENIVIGTAGHVDHGKTTLIRALTGIETDTTTEEKERGMSINIGFAYFDLPSGRRAGIVDVPGHEKFIKNMMAGLSGLNLILLVIDAGEGVMPQTREHMDILQLLGIKNYLIVLSKVATVDEEMIELVEEDIRDQLAGSLLENAPIIKVDSLSGLGLDELKNHIDQISQELEQKNTNLPPRMHVDRAFSVKGFGTIVTGTLIEGTIKQGDDLVIFPAGIPAKVRSIQVHETSVPEAFAGQRTAINLANVKVGEVERGGTLSLVGTMQAGYMLDVKVKVLPHAVRPIHLWDRLRLHIGTREVICRAVPLGTDTIEQGEEAFLQLRLEEEVVANRGDKCILRTYSPMETIAGAMILDPAPKKHKRFSEQTLQALQTWEKGSTEDIITEFVASKSANFATLDDIINHTGLTRTVLEEKIGQLLAAEQLIPLGNMFLEAHQYAAQQEKITSILDRYHKSYRLRAGMPKEELRSRFNQEIKGKDFDQLLELMASDDVIKVDDVLSLKDFTVTYNQYHLRDKAQIEAELDKEKFVPRSIEELTGGDEEKKELIASLQGKSVIRIDGETVMSKAGYDEALQIVKDQIGKNGSITLGEFRDITNSTRKSSTQILEFMDKNKITRRIENERVLV